MTSHSLWQHRISLVMLALVLTACSEAATNAISAPPEPTASNNSSSQQVDYDSRDLTEYSQNWANIYGNLSLDLNGTHSVAPDGEFKVGAAPFQIGADFSVYDHLKYIAISTREFKVPLAGSLEFSVRIQASTPGTQAGRVIHGCYGAPFSYQNVGDPCANPWTSTPLEGQQAGVVLNMINFATGQLFDWFVSDHQVFALVERLPSNVTNPLLQPTDPGYVGLDKAYTQIVKVQDVKPGKKYDVAIRYSRSHTLNRVEFFLDGKLFATVDNVGIPLDVQGVPYTGTYPSLGRGEDLRDQLNSFVIGHGLFSLLDAYPFQHPERPDLSVSIPMSERLFGQGASASYSKFKVTTRTD
jgi:hypothetical protein